MAHSGRNTSVRAEVLSILGLPELNDKADWVLGVTAVADYDSLDAAGRASVRRAMAEAGAATANKLVAEKNKEEVSK